MVKVEKSTGSSFSPTDMGLIGQVVDFEKLGWQSGFYTRRPKKITAGALFRSYWSMKQLGKNALRNWSSHLGFEALTTVTKQSLNERLGEGSTEMAKLALRSVLDHSTKKGAIAVQKKRAGPLTAPFNRVLIRDSTTQLLPGHLNKLFPGNYSHGEQKAVARVQSLFNFTEEKWEDFRVSAYTDNDQKAAGCIATLLQPRDLLLQDLGYFTLDWIGQVTENQYLITKWDNRTALYTAQGERIELSKLAKGKKQVDIPVKVGSKKRLPMRLVIRRLPKAQASKRVREAKKDRHAKANHSKKYLELLRYEIYLTNIGEEMMGGRQIAKLYGLRWYIETLFKSWKSYLNFKTVFQNERMHLHRVLFMIYANLIQIVFLTNVVLRFIKSRTAGTHLSILKCMDSANDYWGYIIKAGAFEDLRQLVAQFEKHAAYTKHPAHDNTINKFLYVKQLCIRFSQT